MSNKCVNSGCGHEESVHDGSFCFISGCKCTGFLHRREATVNIPGEPNYKPWVSAPAPGEKPRQADDVEIRPEDEALATLRYDEWLMTTIGSHEILFTVMCEVAALRRELALRQRALMVLSEDIR